MHPTISFNTKASGRKPMKKTLLTVMIFGLLVSTFAFSFSVKAAENMAPPIQWQQTLMSGDGYSVFQLADGSFILNAANQTATFLVKTDSLGNPTWTKTIQISQKPTVLPYLVPTSEGGYAVAGILNNQYALERTDSEGNLQWTKLYASEAPVTYFRSIIQTSDGGFAIAGFGESAEDTEGQIWFAKTDSLGNLLWNETFAGPIADCPSTIIQLPDGGFMLSDVSYSVTPNQAYMRLIRTDPHGNVMWNQTYGDLGKYRIPEVNCAIKTADDGYLLGGFLSGRNAWVVKTDANGKMEWNQTYGGLNSAVTCIHQLKNGGYIMSAVANLTQVWILKTDGVGNEIWNATFPGATFLVALEANFNSVIQTKNGGYVVLGTKDGRAWLVNLATPANSLTETELIEVGAALIIVIVVIGVSIAFLKQRKKSRDVFKKSHTYLPNI